MDRPITKKKVSPLGLVSVGILAAMLVAFFLIRSNSAHGTKVNIDRLTLSEAQTQRFSDYIPLRVEVEPLQSVFIDAIEGGRVDAIFAEEGDVVAKGQKLLQLSNTQLQLDIYSREALINEQLNNLRNTQLAITQNLVARERAVIELEHALKLAEQSLKKRKQVQHFLSTEAIDILRQERDYHRQRLTLAKSAFDREQSFANVQLPEISANMQRLQNNLRMTQQKLDSLTVAAPTDGRLTAFDMDIGETKNRNERLGQVDKLDGFKLTGHISQFYLKDVREGQIAELVVEQENAQHTYQLKLEKIYSEVENNEFEVDLVFLGEAPSDIRRGQTLKPRLLLGENVSLLAIDNGAFLQDTGGLWIYVLNENDTHATKRKITIGRKTPSQIEILAGLTEGDKIIVSNYENFEKFDVVYLQ